MDRAIIGAMRHNYVRMARITLFVVYYWFGVLKVVGASPATPLVTALQAKTLPFLNADLFLVLFGVLEIIIGIAFLIHGAERVAIGAMALHMVTTAMPLALLPHLVWTSAFVPTLEGQYIIKNLALITVAMGLAARLTPMRVIGRPSGS